MTTKLCIVGEAFGENEAKINFPFVGKAGFALAQMLFEAGFSEVKSAEFYPGSLWMKMIWENSGIHLTNVFMQRPPNNNLEHFLARKNTYEPISKGLHKESPTSTSAKQVLPTEIQARDSGIREDNPEVQRKVEICMDLPAVRPGWFLREEFRFELDRLHKELTELKPNLILALGNTACWGLIQSTKISDLLGTIYNSPFGKVLPTYHPAAVIRNWELRPIVIANLFKAKFEQDSPTFTRKRREIWVEPDIADLWNWWEQHGQHSSLLSIDIETEKQKLISEIGIASDSTHALHVPFIVEKTKPYWPDIDSEAKAWNFIRHVLASPIPKLGQNFLYDIQYLWKVTGIPTKNFLHDTMLLHHALFPGMPKSLGFLGSIYSNEPSWKHLRREGNKDNE